MYDPNKSRQDDLDDLLSQVDALLYPEEPDEEDDFDLADFVPEDMGDEPVVFHNYSNCYGADLRNFSNGYGSGSVPEEESDDIPVIPAYNADFRRPELRKPQNETPRKLEYQDYGGDQEPEEPKHSRKTRKSKPRRGCCGCGCATGMIMLIALFLCVSLVVGFVFQRPDSGVTIEGRKRNTATILICGTDWEGARTDTMMLLYLSGSENRVGLLSLPRDTLTVTSGGNYAKLNSAYGRNGYGQQGMEGLLDYVQEIIGYRPDGYMLVDMDLVPKIVDVMGGVDVNVPMSFELEGERLESGQQHLNGNQVLQLLRFREGYAMQDLDRVKVQRSVISACLNQWFTPGHIKNLGEALDLVENYSTTNLNVRNYLWMAKTALFSLKNMTTDTLPGYADYVAGASYYILNRQEVANLLNESYNPSKNEIKAENLKIAG